MSKANQCGGKGARRKPLAPPTPLSSAGRILSGFSFGGATSFKNCYIDLAFYDGDRSLDIIKTVLRKHRVPKQTNIHFFTSDHAEEVISS